MCALMFVDLIVIVVHTHYVLAHLLSLLCIGHDGFRWRTKAALGGQHPTRHLRSRSLGGHGHACGQALQADLATAKPAGPGCLLHVCLPYHDINEYDATSSLIHFDQLSSRLNYLRIFASLFKVIVHVCVSECWFTFPRRTASPSPTSGVRS